MQYIDITNNIVKEIKQEYKLILQHYYIDNSGNRYDVDNKHVILKPTAIEIKVACILGEIFGGEINIMPVVLNPLGIKTPDYEINSEKFDLKQIFGNGKNTLDDAIKKKEMQSNNFIFDISNTNMKAYEAIQQIERIYESPYRKWVNMIILIKDKDVVKMYKRN